MVQVSVVLLGLALAFAADALAPRLPTPPISFAKYVVDAACADRDLEDLEPLLLSIGMACKAISGLVATADLDGATGYAFGDTVNVQGERQKTLDLVTNDVLKDALRYGGRVGLAASEEEDAPVLVEEAFDRKYVAVFDPLDGSSNVDAAARTCDSALVVFPGPHL